MTLFAPFKSRPVAKSIGVLIVAMLSIQIGAALAKRLFPVVGPCGAVALRLAFAALFLCLVWRPWRLRPRAREARIILGYGLAMGGMNLSFYLSLDHIPLGIAVALEFTGPLVLAMAASRRAVDFVWIALAVLGLLALLPLGHTAKPLAPLGVCYALGAGVGWAVYILFGQKTGSMPAGQTTALGTLVAAIVVVPVGFAQAGTALFSPGLLPVACGVALLSSALPYWLEMLALTRLPTRTFGVSMSLEPALGALSGLIFLGETLTVLQWVAVGSVMIASGGSAATSRTSAGAAIGSA